MAGNALSSDVIESIITGNCRDPFSILGMHKTAEGLVVRTFVPNASQVFVLDRQSQQSRLSLTRIDDRGFYQGLLAVADRPFSYQLDIRWGEYQEIRDDPYSFGLLLQELDTWLLSEGKLLQAYDKLGAHPQKLGDFYGVMFAVWAPNAKRVSVVGDFNSWDGRQHPMRLRQETGIWELFIPKHLIGQLYKYELIDHNNQLILKADPYAFSTELRPNTASRIIALPDKVKPIGAFNYSDDNESTFCQPISIYEVHLGSWQRNADNGWLTYRQLAETLVPYVKEMGFTHLELLPITEHPFDGSWGYQPIGLYSPTSRFGSAADFAHLIQTAHAAGLKVILDWVPGHFPEDAHGLRQFDGTALYEYADPKEGFHNDWNTLIYNYSRYEVKNYLLSNAFYWLDRFAIDGLRFDAVASMIYRDYSRHEGDWIPNKYGGRENLEAIDFLKEINHDIGIYFPNVITIAEESTDFAGVTLPPDKNGLGFHYKWNMGWMHDTLDYFKLDPIYRKYNHQLLTFGMLYAYSENYVLPISHDEVVYGKRSLIEKMSGDEWQKFANLRAYYGFMWAFPGKKLLFMGSEFAQRNEWNHDSQLDWFLLDQQVDNSHRGVLQLVKDLNHCYQTYPALSLLDSKSAGFKWLVVDDGNNSVYVFERRDKQGNAIVVVCNFTPVVHYQYRFGVTNAGHYRELINTDSHYYGGSNVGNQGVLCSSPIVSHNEAHSLVVNLPPLSTLYLLSLGETDDA